MPRLPPSIFRKAYAISPFAATLLPACRDLPSALHELRWIREHVEQLIPSPSSRDRVTVAPGSRHPGRVPRRRHVPDERILLLLLLLRKLCRDRGRGVPLQYVLSTQPFGGLEMKCRPGVLIPRPEPEAYTTYLAELIQAGLLDADLSSRRPPPKPVAVATQKRKKLNILDFCTGTGCIALLLFSLCQPLYPRLHARGIDISPAAISLARENVLHNMRSLGAGLRPHRDPERREDALRGDRNADFVAGVDGGQNRRQTIRFTLADIFSPDEELKKSLLLLPHPRLSASPDETAAAAEGEEEDDGWDIITCNPPYISADGFAHDTARSVRNYEPKLAQVPQDPVPELSHAPGHVLCRRPEDVFYSRLLDITAGYNHDGGGGGGPVLPRASPRRRPRVMLFEVGGMDQAVRVAEMALRKLGPRRRRHTALAAAVAGVDRGGLETTEGKGRDVQLQVVGEDEDEESDGGQDSRLRIEIWRDWPDAEPAGDESRSVEVSGRNVPVRGSGHGRSVFILQR